jgi:hypothetical protein
LRDRNIANKPVYKPLEGETKMRDNLSLLALAVGITIAHVNVAAAEPAPEQSSRPDSDAGRAAPSDDDDGKLEHARNYTAFKDLTGVQKLKTGGLRYSFGPLPGGGFGFLTTGVEAFGSGVKASYNADTGAITYVTPAGLAVTFTAADELLGQSTPQARLYNKVNPAGDVFGGSLTTPVVNAVSLSYTRFGTFYSFGPTTPLDGHAFVLGVPTLARDLPKRGTATYTSAVGGNAFVAGAPVPLDLLGSTATFSANFASGAITTGLNLVGTPVTGGAAIALDTLSGVGAISSAKPGFTGLFTGTGSVAGNFSGAFFGPKAVEFGYDFVVSGTNSVGRQFSAIGGVAGSSAIAPPPPPPPPPAYPAFRDLTGVQTFASAGIKYSIIPVPSGGVGFSTTAVETLGSGVAVQYDTGTGNITFTAPGGTPTTFTSADEVVGQSTPASRLFNKPNAAGGIDGGSLSVPSVNGVELTYTRFATVFSAGTPAGFDGHAVVFGVQTKASDVPTTGTATYTGVAGGAAILANGASASLDGSTASLTADFSTGSIATVLALMMTPIGGTIAPLDVLSGTGSLGAVKPGFSGILTGSGTVSGNFSGAFFGPKAAEFGYDFVVGGTNAAGAGFTAIGGAAGK